MDGIRGEVSNKIRSAIKAKLMELGAYVDDELPDYIMVMVANKRSRQQMEDDLQLFLGDSTSTFTAWLHTVLNKLQQVTVNNTDLKKGSEKKRPSVDDDKRDKKKKVKKEKDKEKPDKLVKTPEKIKIKDSSEDKNGDTSVPQIQGKQIKREPVDQTVNEVSLPPKSSTQIKHQSVSSMSASVQEKHSFHPRANEEEEDDDFINLKADAEADMWGETEETSGAAKNSITIDTLPPSSIATQPKVDQPKGQEIAQEQPKQPSVTSEKSVPVSAPQDTTLISANVSPSKSTESKPAPRIIKISETIRQEQETMKPSSKAVRDPQGLAKRVFQSHIVSLRNAQEKTDRSQRRNSSSHSNTTDNHSRRREVDYRSRNREDLRETLRKERQRERDRSRNREHERRRSGDKPRKAEAVDSSSGRAFSSHRDENSPDPSLLSVVRVTPRPQMPAALQANRSLILKAVAEAQKSVSKPVVRPELVDVKTRIKPLQLKRPMMDKARIRKQLNVDSLSSPKKQKGQSNLKQSVNLPSRDALRKMSFTVRGQTAAPPRETLEAESGDISDESSIIMDPSLNILIQVPASPVEDAREPQDPIQTEKVRRWIKDVEEATKSDTTVHVVKTDLTADAGTEDNYGIESVSKQVSDEEFEDTLEVDTNSLKTSDIHSVVISDDRSLRQPANTQFVVTLDGLDPRLLRSFAMEGDGCEGQMKAQMDTECHQDDRESLIREELVKEQLLREELLRQQAAIREQKATRNNTSTVSSVVAAVKRPASPSGFLEARPPKVTTLQSKNPVTERCLFWPTCKNGEKCEFYHPTVPCKLFPNCKFADRCLYIHPNCRFNSLCARVDCPYTHTGPRPSLTAPTVGTNPLTSQPIKQACKYFPNCSNLSCPYLHPTVCKFGTHCTRPKCQFIHSDKGLATKHKWVRQ